MQEKCCSDFQSAVDEYLLRHRSIIDIMTKFQEASARVNRAFAKSVTECGCVRIQASRQQVPADTSFRDLRKFMSSHLSGQPCEHCQEILSKELGHCLFYLAAICTAADLDLHEVMSRELDNLKTLGIFHLS